MLLKMTCFYPPSLFTLHLFSCYNLVMKKIFLTIITALLMCNQAFATEQVSFVYINGSNNNDVKMKNWFEKGVKKLHPVMKKNFEKYAYTDFLKNGEVTINNEPSMFFWGDKSRRDLSFVEQQLDLSKAFSPTIAYKVRSMLAAFLHDAIWVQKNHHMLTVIDELNEQIASVDSANAPRIAELEKARKEKTPAEVEADKQDQVVRDVETQRNNCGIFKGKEKKALTERLETIERPRLEELKKKAEAERKAHQDQIDAQISEIRNDRKDLRDEVATLKKRDGEIINELTKDR